MRGRTGPSADEGWRESAPFAVSVADYRRAFALAVATDPTPPMPVGAVVRARFVRDWILAAAIGAAVSGFMGLRDYLDHGDMVHAAWQAAWALGWVALLAVPGVLAIELLHVWDARGWRRRFPREASEWKRPARMRVRWNAATLVLAGERGFGSFAWSGLYARLDAPDTLILFTDMHDPVPIPYAALTPDDLADLRMRLDQGEVPTHWSAQPDEVRGLQRVFR